MFENLSLTFWQECLLNIFVVLFVINLFLSILFKIFPVLGTIDTPSVFLLQMKMLFNLLYFLLMTILLLAFGLSYAASYSGIGFFVNHDLITNIIILPISLIIAMHIRSFFLNR